MAYDDRYGRQGGQDRYRTEQGYGRREPYDERDERGFFERMGDWFAGRDEDERDHDRNPGAHTDYYRGGGDYDQRRTGPEGAFVHREDYRRTDRYAESGRADRQRGGRFARDDEFDGGVAPSGRPATGYYGQPGDTYRPSDIGTDRDSVGSQRVGPGSGSSYARDRAIYDQYRRAQARGGQSRDQSREQSGNQSGYGHDPHYSEWRRRQIDSLDRDYDDYRRENAARFDSEFGSWRQTRQGQRQSLGRVAEHMEVVGSDGTHVGTVDKVRGDRVVLTKSDPSAGGHHHSVPCSWIDKVDDKVVLNRSADQARNAWRDEETSRALFEREDRGSEGPHVLGRSFSGTYRDES